MRLATVRVAGGTRAAVLRGEEYVELPFADLGNLLASGADWRQLAGTADGPKHHQDAVGLAPLIPAPRKILCVGLNYADHVEEGGHEPPEFPTIFAKFARALIGPTDAIRLPSISDQADYEAELAIVIGREVRRATMQEAEAAIAGYTVMNDVSIRDYQARTSQWLQGKTFEKTTPLGPVLVTPDEAGDVGSMHVTCELDGVELQSETCDRLLFGPLDLICYVSEFISLEPGDVIATGTPGGVGKARRPQIFLKPGNVLRTRVDGVGECVNVCQPDD